MHKYKVIAFTHKNVGINEISRFHVEDVVLETRLSHLKKETCLNELVYVSTCNRSEFILHMEDHCGKDYLKMFFTAFDPNWTVEEVNWAVDRADVFEGMEAVNHLFKVASSLDSMVIGEREIITQVRNAFEKSLKFKLTGDYLRILINQTIETAKEVYTQTDIARNPVSVVSLAYRKLMEFNVPLDAKFLIIGAGQTNNAMTNFLGKYGYKNFSVFNRTFENAASMAKRIGGQAFPLSELENYKAGFDVIIACTGAHDLVVTNEIYTKIIGADKVQKLVIDLAVPGDFDPEILADNSVNLVAVNDLRKIAEENLNERKKELGSCEVIIDHRLAGFEKVLKQRQVEMAMQEVPKKVKEIHRRAKDEVFAKELEELDDEAKATVEKILAYVEKKYISVPMKMARQIMIDDRNNS